MTTRWLGQSGPFFNTERPLGEKQLHGGRVQLGLNALLFRLGRNGRLWIILFSN